MEKQNYLLHSDGLVGRIILSFCLKNKICDHSKIICNTYYKFKTNYNMLGYFVFIFSKHDFNLGRVCFDIKISQIFFEKYLIAFLQML